MNNINMLLWISAVILVMSAALFLTTAGTQAKDDDKAAELLSQALIIRDKIIRGDEMIGILPPSEKEKMRQLLLKSGEKGNSQAWFELGMAYYQNWFPDDPERDNKAAQYFQQAGELGHGLDAWKMLIKVSYFREPDQIDPSGIKALVEQYVTEDESGEILLLKGYMLHKGYGYGKDNELSKSALALSADLGNADAMFELSIYYRNGYGTDIDPQQAIDWSLRAAENQQTRAMYNLATMYANGYGSIERDIDEAIRWYTKASELGHGGAGENLSIMYALGVETPKNLAKAKYFFQQSFANGGCPEVQYDHFEIDVPDDWWE